MTDIRVVVADDEEWVRTVVVNTIPFEELGLTLVCEASDGLEALELCNRHKPDILITDIRMPGLTGLDLIQKLKQSLPDLKVIIISGFNDFEYAKQAMKYGVQDYLVKPVDEKEIESILHRVKEAIILERKRLDEEMFFKTGYSMAVPVLQEMLLNRIIRPNTLTVDIINKKLAEFGTPLPKGRLSVDVLAQCGFSGFGS